MKRKLLAPLVGLIFVVAGSTAAIMFAKGYRPNFTKKTLQSSGIMVAQSFPDGAQVYINGELKTATNTTFNLDPGTYEVEIKKDGFVPWKKTLIVQAEIVTRATATLFPSVPSLKAITISGATIPVLSPDGAKIAFLTPDKTPKLYTLDLTESPLGFINRDPKLITPISIFDTRYSLLSWSPDSRQLLLAASDSAQIIDTANNQVRALGTASLETLQATWSAQIKTLDSQKFSTLPDELKTILTTATRDLRWSPKEDKILYTATASATLPDNLIRQLPGSSTQPQQRALKPGGVYVYDLEEDRNFLVDTVVISTPTPTNTKSKSTPNDKWQMPNAKSANAGWSWFPNSYHLMKVDNNKITVKEYDNQNATVVYSGPMAEPFAAGFPSGKQILILANLNSATSLVPNLYAISLR